MIYRVQSGETDKLVISMSRKGAVKSALKSAVGHLGLLTSCSRVFDNELNDSYFDTVSVLKELGKWLDDEKENGDE